MTQDFQLLLLYDYVLCIGILGCMIWYRVIRYTPYIYTLYPTYLDLHFDIAKLRDVVYIGARTGFEESILIDSRL